MCLERLKSLNLPTPEFWKPRKGRTIRLKSQFHFLGRESVGINLVANKPLELPIARPAMLGSANSDRFLGFPW